MLNRNHDALTVMGALLLTNRNVLKGTPLTIDTATGKYRKALKADKFAGLSNNYFYVYKDDVNGGEFQTDSGVINLVKIAEVTLSKDVFQDPETLQNVEVYPFDKTKVYRSMDLLYVDAAGLISTVEARNFDGDNYVGYVVKPYIAGVSDEMVIAINVGKKLPIIQISDVTITPNSGTFIGTQIVAMSCATPEVGIFYTTDGTDPVPQQAGTSMYEGPITVDATTTVKAKAYGNPGVTIPSVNITSKTYTQAKVATPVSDTQSGTFVGTKTVNITCDTVDAEIHYSLDGSTPNGLSTLAVNGVIEVDASATLKVIAVKEGYVDSDVISMDFVIE